MNVMPAPVQQVSSDLKTAAHLVWTNCVCNCDKEVTFKGDILDYYRFRMNTAVALCLSHMGICCFLMTLCEYNYMPPTFALRWILAAVSENINLVDCSIRFKQFTKLLFRPRPGNLSNKHFNGINIWLVRVVQGPIHLLPTRKTDNRPLDWS